MKRNRNILYTIGCFVCMCLVFISCKKFEADVAPMTPIDIVGVPDTYASVEENTDLKIPIKFTTPNDSGIQRATYTVVNKRASELKLVFSPPIDIPFNGKSVDATITVPVRRGLSAVVITIYDKAGKLSSRSIDIKSVTLSGENVKSLTNIVMSTDPADDQCFFSLYDPNPVFGQATALTKQDRVDFVMLNNGGAKPISPHAYAASTSFYDASKDYLAGFTTLSYGYLSSPKDYITNADFDAIKTQSDLEEFMDKKVIGPAPEGANYNLVSADRRVGSGFGVNDVDKGFIIGWGYHTGATETPTIVLNEAFALVMVRSVTQKPNGHYIVTMDVKAPPVDERASYSGSSIAPYDPYPL